MKKRLRLVMLSRVSLNMCLCLWSLRIGAVILRRDIVVALGLRVLLRRVLLLLLRRVPCVLTLVEIVLVLLLILSIHLINYKGMHLSIFMI